MYDMILTVAFRDEMMKLAAADKIGRLLAKIAFSKQIAAQTLGSGQRIAGFGSKYTGRIPGISRAAKISDYVAPVAKV